MTKITHRLLWLALITACSIVLVLAPATSEAEAQSGFDQELIRLANAHRATLGLPPLATSTSLSSDSLAWSVVMRDSGNARHATDLGSIGENIGNSHGPVGIPVAVTWNRGAGALPSYCRSSMDYTTTEFLMCGWLSSSGHRAAIESSNYRQMGAGTASGPGAFGRQTYSTLRFTTSAPATPAVDVIEPGHTLAGNGHGDQAIVAVKADGNLWARRDLGSGWSAWSQLANGGWVSTDAAVAPDGTTHIVATASDGELRSIIWYVDGSFSAWTEHGSGWATDTTPSIAANSSEVVLAAIGSNGDLHTKTRQGAWSGSTTHGYNTWVSVDIDIAADGDIWFVGVKTDGRLYVRNHLATSWSGFARMGQPTWSTTVPPAVAARSNGVIVAAVKQDGRLYTREQASGRWAGWVRQGLTDWSSVDVAMTESGHVWLAAVKDWRRLYTHERTAAGSWRPWGAHGADTWSTAAAPSITIVDGTRPALTAVKADTRLYQRAQSSTWGSWLKLGADAWAPGR